MSSHSGPEARFAPGHQAPTPDLLALEGVRETRLQPQVELVADHYDTADKVLARAGVTLERRVGGDDEGWHVEVTATRGRLETRWPLERSTHTPPKPARDLVSGWTRGHPLIPVATVTVHRTATLLLAENAAVLAEFADDRVTGNTPDGGSVTWREWRITQVEGGHDLLSAAAHHLEGNDVPRATTTPVLARALGDRVEARPHLPRPKPGKPASRLVHAGLAELVDTLARLDVQARRGTEEGVHEMRVTVRRLRALLAATRKVLDREATDPVRAELRWLAGVLGEVRDATVVHQRLRALVGEEPPRLVHGPVLRRLATAYRSRGRAELGSALESARYFALRDRLDALVATPPWAEHAGDPAGKVAAKMLHRELERVRARAESAAAHDDAPEALHELRKAVKRFRYVAEAVEPIGGKPVRRLARRAHETATHLGDLQDTVLTRSELVRLARAAAADGEPTFTYGRLHHREEQAQTDLLDAHSTRDTMRSLTTRTDKAAHALRHR
ncbi:CYTH and CHAD domain-containing protein [Nocardioides insulae]|uniref:CYTH and CHAD domain-containing protein n=1 Tax=Nocardioides insulae TaxID=394734 RepID=UPI00040B2991|nr:CYTH and CHAD domain-containing protein [Nocardioides insulae]